MALKAAHLKPEIYFISEAEQIVGRDRLTLRRWWKDGRFPKPTLLNGRLSWRSDVIHQWIQDNV